MKKWAKDYWLAQDWSKPACDMALEHGETTAGIQRIAKELGVKMVRKPGSGRPLDSKWATIDWSKRDIDIAKELGRSRERIRQVRQRLGLPPSGK